MSATTNSLPPLSSEQVNALTHYVERLLDGPTPDESWPTPVEAYVLLQKLSEIREFFQKRQGELLSDGILGNAHKIKDELLGITLVLWQARRRNIELLYGGRVDWDRLDHLQALKWQDRDFFENKFQCHSTEPRRTLLDWANRGQHIGHFAGNDWQDHPEVWQMIYDVATGQLSEATVRAAYSRLFKVFPVLPCPPKTPGSCSSRECIIGNLSAKPIYAAWELHKVAVALGIGGKENA